MTGAGRRIPDWGDRGPPRSARRGAAKAGAGGCVMAGQVGAAAFEVTEGSAPGEEGEGGAGGEETHLAEGLYED